MEVVRIVMLGMTGVLLGLFLKGTRPEYSVYLRPAAGILIFFYMTSKLSYLFSSVMKIQDYLPLDIEYLSTLLKIIGITYIGQFSSVSARMQGMAPLEPRSRSLQSSILWFCLCRYSWLLWKPLHGFCHEEKKQTKENSPFIFFTFLGDFVFGAARTGCGKNGASIGEEAGIIPEEEAAAETAKQRSDQGENQAKEGTGDQNEAALEEELLREQEESQEALLEGLELGGRDAGSGKRTAGGEIPSVSGKHWRGYFREKRLFPWIS